MNDSITVVYLKKNKYLDISTEDKVQNAAIKITNLILKRVEPLYTIVLTNLYDEFLEQMFKEDVYDIINNSVKRYIYDMVYDYIKENEYINIEGFIIFRLKSLWDIIDSAIHEYIVLQDEYSILSNYLYEITEQSQNICDTVTIIAEADNYSVYNENMDIMAYVKKYGDTLLDIILNIAPKKIYIYNKEYFSSETLLNNILAIFKEKVILQPI